MRTLLKVFCIVPVFCLSAAVLSAQPLTAQTSVPPPLQPPVTVQNNLQTPANIFDGDARLSQKVAVRVEGMPLDELLARLTQQTGVTLKVQQDIADEKVIVFSPARPLHALLSDIAALLNNTWMRQEQPGGKPLYRMVRNGRAREYEDRLLEKINNRLRMRIEEQARALADAPAERKRRPENDPIRERLSDPRGQVGTRFYALLNAAQRQSLFARDYFDVPYSALSSRQQAALRNAFTELNAANPLEGTEGAKANGVPADIEHSVLRFSRYAQGGRQAVSFGFDPPGYGLDGIVIAYVDGPVEWLLPPHGNPYTGAPVSAHASLPHAEIVERVASEVLDMDKSWLDGLEKLAEQTGTAICADFYRSKAAHPIRSEGRDARSGGVTGHGSSIAELDDFCRPAGYLWWMQGKTLLLRKRDWFEQRLYEVPDRWILATAKRLQAQKGIPTHGDVVRLLELTTEQIAGLMSFSAGTQGAWYADLGAMKTRVNGCRELLEIWNAFPNGGQDPLPGRETFADAAAYQKQYAQSIRAYGDFTDAQRSLAVNFVNGDYVFGMAVTRRRHPVTAVEMANFRTRLAGPPPSASQPTDAARASDIAVAVPIELSWWMEGETDFNQCRLFLPTALPLDRRAKTQIELAP